MALIVVALVLAWPVIELLALIAVAEQIGLGPALLLLVLVSVAGAYLLKRTGLAVWRRANGEISAGRPPTGQLIDGVLAIGGGVAMVVPGFVSGVLGALLLLPPVRALLRPLLASWTASRAAKAARSGRVSGIMVDTVVGADGRVRRRTRTFGDVIDSEGWEVGQEQNELRPGVIDVDGRPDPER